MCTYRNHYEILLVREYVEVRCKGLAGSAATMTTAGTASAHVGTATSERLRKIRRRGLIGFGVAEQHTIRLRYPRDIVMEPKLTALNGRYRTGPYVLR